MVKLLICRRISRRSALRNRTRWRWSYDKMIRFSTVHMYSPPDFIRNLFLFIRCPQKRVTSKDSHTHTHTHTHTQRERERKKERKKERKRERGSRGLVITLLLILISCLVNIRNVRKRKVEFRGGVSKYTGSITLILPLKQY
jgi:hypothetical protein